MEIQLKKLNQIRMKNRPENPRGRLRNNKHQGGFIKKIDKTYYHLAATEQILFLFENLVILHNK